jgi:hypothetical protein
MRGRTQAAREIGDVSRESVSENDLAHYSLASPSATEMWERKPKGGGEPFNRDVGTEPHIPADSQASGHQVPRSCRCAHHYVYQPN